MLTRWLFVVLLIGQVVVLLHVVLASEFYRILRERHPNVWERLGSPTRLPSYLSSSGFALLGFLIRNEYRSLGDGELTKAAPLAKWTMLAFYPFAAAFFMLMLFGGLLLGG